MSGLTQDRIAEIYAKRRTKGDYVEILKQAHESDESGFAAKETYPRLKDKAAATLYQGFRNAAEKLNMEDNVDVINSDDEVYVIFKDRVEFAVSDDD